MMESAPIILGTVSTVGTAGGVPWVVASPSTIILALVIGPIAVPLLTTGAIHGLGGSGDSPIHTNFDGRELDVLVDDGEIPFRMGSGHLLVHLGHHGKPVLTGRRQAMQVHHRVVRKK
jgi:hypothetical protein